MPDTDFVPPPTPAPPAPVVTEDVRVWTVAGVLVGFILGVLASIGILLPYLEPPAPPAQTIVITSP